MWGCIKAENREKEPDATKWLEVVDLIQTALREVHLAGDTT